MAADLDFSSADSKFGLAISSERISDMLTHCREAGDDETGGILMGRYNAAHDRAIVTEVVGPPADSRATRTGFLRGVRGLPALMLRAWRDRGEYYLGEWHYHPGASPTPSSIDRAQMRAFAENPARKCPEPILLVIGGDPSTECRLNVSVTYRGEMIPLEPSGAQGEALGLT